MKHRAIALLILCQSIAALAQEEMIRLPLRVHLVTGVEMVRESQTTDAAPIRTVMNMPVKEQDMRDIMKQVNEIWPPANKP